MFSKLKRERGKGRINRVQFFLEIKDLWFERKQHNI